MILLPPSSKSLDYMCCNICKCRGHTTDLILSGLLCEGQGGEGEKLESEGAMKAERDRDRQLESNWEKEKEGGDILDIERGGETKAERGCSDGPVLYIRCTAEVCLAHTWQ